jgi:hypothetical protein
MGQEFVFGIGALLLCSALIFGVRQYQRRNKAAVREGDKIVADRYRNDET